MGKKWPIAIDLFSGCGAMTQALKNRHFNVVAAIENDPIAATTYRSNHKTVHLYEQDIRKFDPFTILENDLEGEETDLLVVCAPCQPFSSQNNYNGKGERRSLILESIKFVKYLKPKIVFLENVPGLKTKNFKSLLNKLGENLNKNGYKLNEPEKVNAADYGVPQRRERCVMFAAKEPYEIPTIPDPVTPPGSRVTVNEQIGHLENLDSGGKSKTDRLHFARNHQQKTLNRIKHVPPGGSRLSIPKELWLNCHKKYNGHLDVLGRMNGEDVAPTLTRGCTDVYKGQYTHPQDDRAITLREASLLQTFPENYEFHGNSTQIASQIGNAVPIKMVEELTSSFREVI